MHYTDVTQDVMRLFNQQLLRAEKEDIKFVDLCEANSLTTGGFRSQMGQ